MYSEFARFYDRVEVDAPRASARWILERVDAHQASVASVLELGCGTGAVLQALPDAWRKTGVDSSPEMLAQARAKSLDATIIGADMTSLSLGERFDLVICVFDTINHLVDPEQWRRAFIVARQHLRIGGLFAFDMNTVTRLREIAAKPASSYGVHGDTILIQVHERRPLRFDWEITVSETTADGYLSSTKR